ncbi:ceramide kinase-like [Saccostrea echinata]|uniref:ceramide kinase-like n=1 Tax=Saccostrea echinata TaxID=191078 RepID=UPI002A8226E0|nr:ceramide kinase-like [Saccostrea echinata]
MWLNDSDDQLTFRNSRLYYKSSSMNWEIDERLILQSEVQISNGSASLEIVYVIEKYPKLAVGKIRLPETEEKCLEIQKAIESSTRGKKPKRLLVFINPRSGKREAEKIYKKKVLPIFQLCKVEINKYVTNRANEVRDCLLRENLDLYDGVVAVGGDGIYNEVLSGLVNGQMRDIGLNPDDPESKLPQLKLPVGIIPAGSGNYTAWYLNGTKCPKTAAIRIVMGDCVATNIASLHQGNKCSGYSSLILGFGLFGDVMRDCEKYRWMGTSRFKVIPVGTVLGRRPVKVAISYIPAESDNNMEINNNTASLKPEFHRQSSVPPPSSKKVLESFKKRTFSTSDILEAPSEWKTTEDRVVYAVDTYPITMKPKGTKMVPHFGDDSLKLLITRKCKLIDHIRQLKEVDDGKSTCYEFDFVRAIEVQRYRVRVLKNASEDFYVNCDGEVIRLEEPEFEVSLHKKVVQLYGKSREELT